MGKNYFDEKPFPPIYERKPAFLWKKGKTSDEYGQWLAQVLVKMLIGDK